ncbi:MAG: VWA domain-containing protein [Planctomycetes bacterium]|nr:VWA domain-containing protein [Planctomycetota bacterium]
MGFRFENPWALLLLLTLPFVYMMARRSIAGLSTFRRWAALAVRMVILVLLVLALAQLQQTESNDVVSVMYVLDYSASIPHKLRGEALEYINQTLAAKGDSDTAGVVVFGGDAALERPPAGVQEDLTKLTSVVSSDHTDIGQAIRLALASFPENTQKRIVLLSDGNENKGRAVEEARNAKANQAPIDVLPLHFRYPNEVIAEKIDVPNEVKEDEPFDVKLTLRSQQDTTGRVRIFQNGAPIVEQNVNLTAGKNVFVIKRKLEQTGFYKFDAVVEAPHDTLPENNAVSNYTSVFGEPRLLFITGKGMDADGFLIHKLRKENLRIDVIGARDIPRSARELQNYDSIVLSDVSVEFLSREQMDLIESCVKDSGIGLVMIGGEDSFGAGGYLNTPIERALPVTMDVKQKKVLPNGALVLVLHTCEFPDGNSWAKKIAREAVRVLSPRDYVGALAYGMGGEQWLFPLQRASNKEKLYSIIDRSFPGDMPSFATTMTMARDGLNSIKAALKHIVIISDGDPQPPSQALMQSIVKGKITVSTVVISPHTPRDKGVMAAVAKQGKGRYYDVASPSRLPEIFIKEARVIQRTLIFEETFTPRLTVPTEVVSGIARGGIPQLLGYVITTAKDRAEVPLVSHHRDPILAHWQYGLGKSVAFTSDARNRWAAHWLAWPKYGKLWAQIMRWTFRQRSRSGLKVATSTEGGAGRLIIDAVDDEGKFVNFLDIVGNVVSPSFKAAPLKIEQTSPGRYEASFDAKDVGEYILNIGTRKKEGGYGFFTTGASVAYSSEYLNLTSNDALLRKIATLTGGKVLPKEPKEANVFRRTEERAVTTIDLWPLLLMASVLLFPLDVFFRRVLLDYGKILAWFGSIIPRLRGKYQRPKSDYEQTLDRFKAMKEKRAAERRERREGKERAYVPDYAEREVEARPEPTREPKAAAPVATPEPEPEEKPADGYTSRLLQAKKRALKDKKDKENKEDT